MGVRRNARELALQMLYQMDFNGSGVPFWPAEKIAPDARAFSEQLFHGVMQHRPGIDQHIRAAAQHWTFERIAVVDRNILRLAVYELQQMPDTPYRVTLNEAIEIAKKYGSEDSGAFVNGVLDRICRETRPEKAVPSGGSKRVIVHD
jgi:N utilization substance protein B